MSDGINKVFLFGNLGADAELKETPSGAILKFRLATTTSWVDKEEKKQSRTEWHTVKVFGKRAAGLAPYLHKGDRLFVEGEMRYSSYEKDGQKKYTSEIIAEDITFGGGRSNGAYVPAAAASSPNAVAAPF